MKTKNDQGEWKRLSRGMLGNKPKERFILTPK